MTKVKVSPRTLAAIAAAVASASAAATASAQNTPEVVWNNLTSGNYNTATNWTPNGTPSNAALQFLEIDNGGTAIVNGAATYEGALLHLGLRSGKSGSLLISGGTMNLGELHVGGRDTIPNNFSDWTAGATANSGGSGFVIQSAGTVNVTYNGVSDPPSQSLFVGEGGLSAGNTAVGSYTISGGNLNVGIATSDQIVIGSGAAAQGTFDHQNGTVASTGSVIVGRRGATGIYTLSGATSILTAATDLFVGDGESNAAVTGTSGSFDQSNGAVTSTLSTSVGRNGGNGTYTINGGSLTANTTLDIGFGGTGNFVQGNTTSNPNVPVISKQSMQVGASSGSLTGVGGYTLNSGTLAVGTGTGHLLYVGRGPGSVGTFTQKAGTTVTLAGGLHIGDNSTGNNFYDMQGGTLTTVGDLDVGGFGVAGQSGNGTFTQTAGSVKVGSNVVIGFASNTANTGLYELKGGSLELTRTGPAGTQTILAIGNGNGGAGTFLQTGGTLDVNMRTDRADSIIDVGRGGVGSGTYTLTSGVLDTQWFRLMTNANNRANFDGGTSTIVTNFAVAGGIASFTAGTHTISGTTNLSGAGLLHVSGGTVNFGGTGTSAPTFALSGTSTLWISGGTTSVGTGTFSLGSGTTLRTSIPFTIAGQFRIGNSTVQVDADELKLTGEVFSDFPRTLTKTGAGTLTMTGTQTHTELVSGSTYAVTGGTLNLHSNGGPNLTINANAGTTNLRATLTPTPVNVQTLRAVNVGATGLAVMEHTAARDGVLKATTVTVADGGKLDLKNNKLIDVGDAPNSTWSGSSYGGTVGLIQKGYASGAWTGSGIVTTESAAATHVASLGSASADDLGVAGGTFAGQSVASGDLLVAYTYAGDADLNGKINGDDYFRIDSHVGTATPSWFNGDFDYNGKVDGDDYFLIDSNVSNPPLAALPDTAVVPAGLTAVPEPASALTVTMLGAAAALRRQRRKRHALAR
jgi:hypothetical protein